MKSLDLTMEEIGILLVLASESDPDPDKTDPEVLAAYHKARSVVERRGESVKLSASISIRRTR